MDHRREDVPQRGIASSAVAVRRAGPADAATVQCMVDEIAEHEGQGDAVATTADTDNHDAQRFYHRLGARLRHKVVAVWTPQEYTPCVAAIPGETS